MTSLKFYSRQARQPSGLFGRFFMSQIFEKGNSELNNHLFNLLSVKESDRILELGSGPGKLVSKIAHQLTTGMVQGVDFSKSMIAVSRKKNKKHITSGKAEFHMGNFEEIPFSPNSFNKVFSVNSIYFWQNPDTIIAKIVGALIPGGQLFIGYHERSEMEKMPLDQAVFNYYSVEEVERLFSSNGWLTKIETIAQKGEKKTCYCTIGTKSNT